MSLINWIFRLFINSNKEIIIEKLRRNDLCYCGSGLKFKKCHASILQTKNQIAYRVFNPETKQESIKVLKTGKNSMRMKSNLRLEDIAGGGS